MTPILGWKSIAAELGVSISTAKRWAHKDIKPLPVRYWYKKPILLRADLEKWVRSWAKTAKI